MKWLKQRWRRWKEKHWDEDWFVKDGEVPWIGMNRPPLRTLWEGHKGWIIPRAKWLAGLIIGALILSAIGLG